MPIIFEFLCFWIPDRDLWWYLVTFKLDREGIAPLLACCFAAMIWTNVSIYAMLNYTKFINCVFIFIRLLARKFAEFDDWAFQNVCWSSNSSYSNNAVGTWMNINNSC